MGYMPVITNMAAPILDHVSKKESDIYFKALKFNSFAEMAEALRNDEIQAAFMIAPLSVVLRQQGVDIKVVYIGNRHESTLVAKKELKVKSIQDLAGKTIAVPMRYSGHNISLLELMEQNNLAGQINIVEMNPPDMASAMVAGALDAYYVGEPFAAQSLKNGSAELVFYVEEVWKSFICNLVIVKQSLIEEDQETVQKLVHGAVRSGIWAGKHLDEAAQIAARYWSQPVELVQYALNTERTIVDQFTPKIEEMQEIADLMVKHSLIDVDTIEGLVDDQFARSVKVDDVEVLDDIL
ncbi:MAG: ABC transporter substrate-binding protein [Candidatus Electrothrix sp. AR3]|nr:ABC transporter substrate-binding protein [Candidatus Electrothrix sp. AR3]